MQRIICHAVRIPEIIAQVRRDMSLGYRVSAEWPGTPHGCDDIACWQQHRSEFERYLRRTVEFFRHVAEGQNRQKPTTLVLGAAARKRAKSDEIHPGDPCPELYLAGEADCIVFSCCACDD